MREPVRGISDGKFLPRLFISVQHITNQPKQGEQVDAKVINKWKLKLPKNTEMK